MACIFSLLFHLSSDWAFYLKTMCFVQIADLDSEDSKKDTMVDVVFKKALKEFRINIFNSYSTALAVSLRLTSVFLFLTQLISLMLWFWTVWICALTPDGWWEEHPLQGSLCPVRAHPGEDHASGAERLERVARQSVGQHVQGVPGWVHDRVQAHGGDRRKGEMFGILYINHQWFINAKYN